MTISHAAKCKGYQRLNIAKPGAFEVRFYSRKVARQGNDAAVQQCSNAGTQQHKAKQRGSAAARLSGSAVVQQCCSAVVQHSSAAGIQHYGIGTPQHKAQQRGSDTSQNMVPGGCNLLHAITAQGIIHSGIILI